MRWIPFGTVSRAHGVRGELRIVPHHPGDVLPDAASQVRLVSKDGRSTQTYGVKRARPVHDAVLLTLDGVDDREAAQALRGYQLELSESELPPLEEGELYLYELIGARVVAESGLELGTVRGVLDNRGQDLLAIETPGGEKLLPWVEETRVDFDRSSRTLTVRLPAGLWED